jgi:putative ABC transport system permease protein
MRQLLRRVWYVIRQGQLESDLAEEMDLHRDLKERELRQHWGASLDAGLAARRELGNATLVREHARAVWIPPWLEGLCQDAIHTVRQMRRQPGFAAVAVATLMIGIGANTAIFSVVNAVLLRPLRVPDADRIVRFVRTSPNGAFPMASLPLAGIWLQQGGVFHDISAHRLDLVNLTGTSNPEQVPVARVTKDFFRLFGAPIVAGRTFSADEDRPRGGLVAVLSYGLWVRQFGAMPEVVGSTITLGSEPHVVVGILGAGFDSEQFDQVPDVWVPLQLDPNTLDVGGEWCFVNAGLKAGGTIGMANAQLEVAANDYRRTHPQNQIGVGPNVSFAVQPVRDAIVRDVRSSLTLLEGAVTLVLLIACANVANLLLIRGTARTREMAVRAAIGAGRGRLIRQLITESTVLALAGAVCGLGFGMLGIRLLLARYPTTNPTMLVSNDVSIPRIGVHGASVSLDWRVLAFTVSISLIASILSGVFPALQASRVDLHLALKQTGGSGSGLRHKRVRSGLVVSEIALALMLLVGAGLLIRTSLALRAVKPGFDTHDVLTMRMSVSGTPFERRDGIARLTRQGLDRVLAVPGVNAASTTCCMPLETVWQLPFVVQGRPLTGAFHAFAGWTFVSPGYFDVFRVPILRGRDFHARDDAGAPGVVIINQEMARRFWPTGDPLNDRLIIGRNVRPDYEADPIRQIIGIVGDVRDQGLRWTPRPAMYVPVAQVPDGVTMLNVRLLPMVWVARAKGEPRAQGPVIEKVLQEVSGGLPVARIRSMDEVVSESTARTRFDMLLMSVFAASALVLAAVGVYGLMAYSVEQRTQEIGIRLALGASPDGVRRIVLRQGMTLAIVGIAIGTMASFSFARVLAGVLFGVTPRDPAIFISVPLLLASVTLLAVSLPAIRAARMTPMNALRYE